jgi:outer membrane protein TolC
MLQNPQVKAAEEAIAKAEAAVASAKTAYIPDVTAYVRQSYQDGLPFLARNFGTFGVNMTWDLFDFGKRRAAVRERQDELEEARENLRRAQDQVAVSIARSYNKVERTKNLIDVAQEVVKLRQESERLARNQNAQGVVMVSDYRQATAATYRAQADLLQANLGYLLARAELQASAGMTPGF